MSMYKEVMERDLLQDLQRKRNEDKNMILITWQLIFQT